MHITKRDNAIICMVPCDKLERRVGRGVWIVEMERGIALGAASDDKGAVVARTTGEGEGAEISS